MMARYSPEELAHGEHFITDFVATMNGYIKELARQDDT
jgi:hypothetical protein